MPSDFGRHALGNSTYAYLSLSRAYALLLARFSPLSIAATRVLSTLIRAKYLLLASTRVQGAVTVDVRSTISETATSYSSHFFRLRQSSGVIL